MYIYIYIYTHTYIGRYVACSGRDLFDHLAEASHLVDEARTLCGSDATQRGTKARTASGCDGRRAQALCLLLLLLPLLSASLFAKQCGVVNRSCQLAFYKVVVMFC